LWLRSRNCAERDVHKGDSYRSADNLELRGFKVAQRGSSGDRLGAIAALAVAVGQTLIRRRADE
jgi:hypothetical protein